jgi:hypothetical protein
MPTVALSRLLLTFSVSQVSNSTDQGDFHGSPSTHLPLILSPSTWQVSNVHQCTSSSRCRRSARAQ